MLRTTSICALTSLCLLVTACEERRSDPAPTSPPPPRRHASGHGAAGGAAPHGNHDPKHGGLVLMHGTDLHYEVVLGADGRHELWLSDGARRDLPASAASGVTMTVKRKSGEAAEALTAAPDPAGASWIAQGRPLTDGGDLVEVSFTVPGATVRNAVALDDARRRGGPAHGGLVRHTERGTLELVAGRDGRFQIWMSDHDGKPRDAAGATGRVRLAVPGYAEVAMAPSGDHLAGQGAPIAAEHAPVLVTVEQGGASEMARFDLHVESTPPDHGSKTPTH